MLFGYGSTISIDLSSHFRASSSLLSSERCTGTTTRVERNDRRAAVGGFHEQQTPPLDESGQQSSLSQQVPSQQF